MEDAVLDDIISRLRDDGRAAHLRLSESEVRQLCMAASDIFLKQPNLLELSAPVVVCGDIHGQYSDLLRLFEWAGFPPAANYIFLGNYVDYGKQSLETICLLLAYKIKFPENFFLLRGSHECASMSHIYGFYGECKRRFYARTWIAFVYCFNCLPVAALIEDEIFCVHGGLSPDLDDLGQINKIKRPTDVPATGLLCDLIWSDPSASVKGWGFNDRGVSYGPDKVSEFLQKHHLGCICRSHQVVDGYEFFSSRQLVTIFSAPGFRGEFDNAGAVMSVDETLLCSFKILMHHGRTPPPGVEDNKETSRESCATTSQYKSLNLSEGTSSTRSSNLSTETLSAEISNLSKETSSVKVFSYLDIESATNGLGESSKIGQGGYGSVHKGLNLEGTSSTRSSNLSTETLSAEISNLSKETSSVKVFSYLDIESATNGLSESSKIGQGGYGSVHKGLNLEGTSSTRSSNLSTETLSAEISNLSKETSSVKVFSYLDIESATNGLSESSKIGQGGYGSVHKGLNLEGTSSTRSSNLSTETLSAEILNLSKETSSVKVFSYLDIESATNGLSESSKIGQGGYGSVHRGYLDNVEVAIKMLDSKSKQGLEEFIQELEVLGQMRHPNLVKLIGACFRLRCLVYEFVPNGSLEDCLKKRPRLLTWQMRTRIVYEICSALIFLHSNKPHPLVHGDIKPHNILLDVNFNSKLADFGLCRFLPEGTSTIAFLDTKPKGTLEYIDPVFLKTGILTALSDVYSFGITIFRLLTGMEPLGIVRKVRAAYVGESLMTMVDSTAGHWPTDVAGYLAKFGLECCNKKKSSELLSWIAADLEDILPVIGS